ncbi:LLM class F420-dependent oxidoreductase [Kallotenue papyrolyticum]|uniref:LLM class F420-dependent oxidoreductase n=1 Tax=Kallotenue papyrolyticum TaxID=1325125 RepID=UPI00046FAF5C|nr:LLM class F420-dependent oxidoreductase [Kallotenue papyrolyticum]
MTPPHPLRFGIQAGPVDIPYTARRTYWQEAEHLGYDWASVGDHFMPNPIFGARDTDPWSEAWTTLAALAEATTRIRIGVLVTSVGFRHPALLAKMAATLDVISGGRLEFGIGAGYLEAEYRMYGLPFPPAAVRLAQLDEAIRVCKRLWTQAHADFAGKQFALVDAVCEPKPVQRPHPPIWVGGGGEQKTLRIVAEHADGWNAFPAPIEQLQHKLDVLRGHCDAVGRDYGAIRKQLVCTVIVRADAAQVAVELARFAAERRAPPDRARQMAIAGTPAQVTAALTPYISLGFDMFLLMERAPLDDETLHLFMHEVAPRLRAAAGHV